MDWIRRIREAFEAAGRPVTDAVVEELAEHAADLAGALERERVPRAEVRRRVDAEIEALVSRMPPRPPGRRAGPEPPPARLPLLSSLSREIGYAVRVLVRQPAASAVGALTIALAICAVAVMAALVWRVLYQPLPWADADRLARLYESRRGGSASFGQFGAIMTNGSYLAWQRSPATIDGIAAYSRGEQTLTGPGRAERIRTASVSPSLFDVLGVRPALGRAFTDADTPPGAAPVAVVSHAFWQQRLEGRADAVGASVRLDGEPVSIVGVLGPGVAFPDPAVALWRPLHVPPTVTPGSSSGNIRMFNALARLRPGVTPEQAAAEGSARAQAAPQAGPVAIAVFGSDGPAEVRVVRLLDDETREVRPALLLLLAAVVLLLLASAANVANVQLARALARRRELAIRSALGADARALARQLVVEGAVLGACGGVIGLLTATALTAALPSWLPADFPRIDEIAMDWRGALAALAAALMAGAAAGALPAWYARRAASAQALNEDGHSAVGVGHRSAAGRARSLVMAAQVAIATVLLVGASLLGRSFLALLDADRGFDTASVLTAELPLPRGTTGARRQAILDAAVERLEAVPGVVAAGYTSILPLSGSESIQAFEMPGRDGQARRVRTSFRVVSAGYMSALGMRVRAGRLFDRRDSSTSQRVCVVNLAFAQEYLDESPLDSEIPGTDGENRPPFRVVGVVDDVRSADGTPVGPEMFVAQPQWTEDRIGGDPVLALRTIGAPHEIAPVVRSIVDGIDPALALGKVATMEDRVVEQLARPRLYAALLGAFAALSLAIAGVGLFGVLSFSVAQRSRELAVRSALGAAPASLVALVIRQGLGVTAAGLAAGVAISAALAGWLGGWLYGIDARDPQTYVAVAGFLLVVATAASAAPAVRAARLDPLVVLKRG